ncbi:hypothetical protein PHK61_09700 [Actinomycetospora lutea]|uniref:hypothetical protein n=1 Tax=Actinomycetospora lutea TaxID=663604 RepID=UPI0023661E27|nr:hypothetical protein [Actinomycetospora lutea]MDD7938689.1 hypothetical protein [Actinomycetospora lutea]
MWRLPTSPWDDQPAPPVGSFYNLQTGEVVLPRAMRLAAEFLGELDATEVGELLNEQLVPPRARRATHDVVSRLHEVTGLTPLQAQCFVASFVWIVVFLALSLGALEYPDLAEQMNDLLGLNAFTLASAAGAFAGFAVRAATERKPPAPPGGD